MRGADSRTGELFSYVDLQVRGAPSAVGIRFLVNELLAALAEEFAKFYTESGRALDCPGATIHSARPCTHLWTPREMQAVFEEVRHVVGCCHLSGL
jgi:hypothetical protein